MVIALLGVIAALLSGGAVGLFLARARRDSIVVEASEKAVGVVEHAMQRLEAEVRTCHEDMSALEAQLAREMAKTISLTKQVKLLSREVDRLGGDASVILGA